VSKNNPLSAILEAKNCGLLNFGENKAQELNTKAGELHNDFFWHFIGHLQTNKVKYVINYAEYIHSIDSIKLASEVEKRAGRIGKNQKVLLEINTSMEASKFGLVHEENIFNLAEYCEKSESLDLVGLMTMAPYTDDGKIIRNCFVELRNIYNSILR
jgi:pyridoxal phosphate enzyme (YggS family)